MGGRTDYEAGKHFLEVLRRFGADGFVVFLAHENESKTLAALVAFLRAAAFELARVLSERLARGAQIERIFPFVRERRKASRTCASSRGTVVSSAPQGRRGPPRRRGLR